MLSKDIKNEFQWRKILLNYEDNEDKHKKYDNEEELKKFYCTMVS
jgi:hypothetical protein